MKFKTCYECPKYHHGGAFGRPRYVPYCGSSKLPKKVDDKNHASPDHDRINCVHLDK